MTNHPFPARSIAPARHKLTPAAGCFGFTKSDIERLQSERLAANKLAQSPYLLSA